MYSGEDPQNKWDDDAHEGEEPPNEEEMDELVATYFQGQKAKKRMMGNKGKGKGKGKLVTVK
eukprot:14359855-Heterocapsa_arctica.AAC.1